MEVGMLVRVLVGAAAVAVIALVGFFFWDRSVQAGEDARRSQILSEIQTCDAYRASYAKRMDDQLRIKIEDCQARDR
jgi:hypothetical protein